MIRIIVLFLGLMVIVNNSTKASDYQRAIVPFYSEKLFVNFNPDLLSPKLTDLKEKSMVEYYHQLLKTDFSPLISDLKTKKQVLEI